MTKFQWPHPTNTEFNKKIRSIVKMYGTCPPRDKESLLKAKEYLSSCVKNILEHKVKRETEQYYKLLHLKMEHGIEKSQKDRNELIYNSNVLFFTGDWRDYEPCLEDYRYASVLGRSRFEIFHNPRIDMGQTVRYLAPIRPIEDVVWDPKKAQDILVYETPEKKYEVIDGNHRHEFAERLGSVESISGWVIRDV
jgi:hypothetical protein|tara:strand:+ start:352 stop:933 length:582 start_codon:yes stop_codon:yes gene_type:complete